MFITCGWTHPLLCEQEDAALFGDGVVCVELHQSVEGVEGLAPQVILTVRVSHHFKVLHIVLMSDGRNTHSIKTITSIECPVKHGNRYVCVCALYLTEMENAPGELWEPRMRKDPIG